MQRIINQPTPRIISIPLADGMYDILTCEDGRYAGLVLAMLGPLDKLATPILRWPAVFQSMFNPNVGPVIEFMSDTSAASITVRALFYAVCAVAAGVNTYLEYQEQEEQRKKRLSRIQDIKSLIAEQAENKNKRLIPGIDRALLDEVDEAEKFYELNRYLNEVLYEDEILKKKYRSIEVNCHKDGDKNVYSLDFELREAEEADEFEFLGVPERTNRKWWEYISSILWEKAWKQVLWGKIFKPLWNSGGLAAFTFWIMWIMVGATVGIHVEGIYGISSLASILVPLVVAIPFIGWRIQNWRKNRSGNSLLEMDENARLTEEARIDADKLIEQVSKKQHYQRELDKLNAAIIRWGGDAKNVPQPRLYGVAKEEADAWYKPFVKGSVTFVLDSSSSWGGTQYLAWYSKVFLDVAFSLSLAIPVVNTVIGSVMIGVACLFGIAAFVKRYQEAQAVKDELQRQEASPTPKVTLDQLQAHYNVRLEHFNTLKKTLVEHNEVCKKAGMEGFYLPECLVDAPQESLGMRAATAIRHSKYVTLFDWFMTGFVFIRNVITPAAMFLPFVFLSVNPYTLPVAIVVAALYVVMRRYEQKQKEREDRLKKLPDELEKLEADIALAEKSEVCKKLQEQHQWVANGVVRSAHSADSEHRALIGARTTFGPMFAANHPIEPADETPVCAPVCVVS